MRLRCCHVFHHTHSLSVSIERKAESLYFILYFFHVSQIFPFFAFNERFKTWIESLPICFGIQFRQAEDSREETKFKHFFLECNFFGVYTSDLQHHHRYVLVERTFNRKTKDSERGEQIFLLVLVRPRLSLTL
jgi:hypothetical protein